MASSSFEVRVYEVRIELQLLSSWICVDRLFQHWLAIGLLLRDSQQGLLVLFSFLVLLLSFPYVSIAPELRS